MKLPPFSLLQGENCLALAAEATGRAAARDVSGGQMVMWGGAGVMASVNGEGIQMVEVENVITKVKQLGLLLYCCIFYY